MANYCRYCSYCIDGDCFFCTLHEKCLNENRIRRATQCEDFNLSELGDIITGKQYKPRERIIYQGEQMKIDL